MSWFKKDKLNFLARIFIFYKNYKKYIALGLVIVILGKMLYGATPFIFREIINFLQVNSQGGYHGLASFPVYLFLIYVTLRVFDRVLCELQEVVSGKFLDGLRKDVTLKTLNHLHRVDLSLYSMGRAGSLVRDVEKGVDAVVSSAKTVLFNILPIFFEVVVVLGIFYYLYDNTIGNILLCSIVIFLVVSIVSSRLRTDQSWEVVKVSRSISSKFVDAVINFENSRIFGSSQYEMKRHTADCDELIGKVKNQRRFNIASSSIKSFITTVTICLILGIAIFDVAKGDMLLGDLALINILLIRLHRPLGAAGDLYFSLGTYSLHLERLIHILDFKMAVKEVKGAGFLEKIESISFSNVSFSYDGEKSVMKDVNFTLNKSDSLYVVGPSGSGKSTLSKILLRLYGVDAGKYCINGVSVENFTLDSIREKVSIVSQDTILFNDTLRNNIVYGRNDILEADIWNVLESVALADLVRSLSLGLDTVVGDRGIRFSGGEKQRVLLARALLRNPDVIIFDEATSALDKFSEQKIFEVTRQLIGKSIVIVITHDVASIGNEEKIMCFEGAGRVCIGSHFDLQNTSAAYKRLISVETPVFDNEQQYPVVEPVEKC